MKGHAAAVLLGKRRWRGPAAAVLALVFLSVLFPPAFLLGVNRRLPSGFLIEDRLQLETSFFSHGRADSIHESLEGAHARIGVNGIKRFGVSSEKEFRSRKAMMPTDLHGNTREMSTSRQKDFKIHLKNFELEDSSMHSKVTPTPEMSKALLCPSFNAKKNSVGTESTCVLEFGSYCLWSVEHEENMKDSIVRRMKDQLFVARSYNPSIAKLKAREKLSSKLKQNIQEHERMLSDAISNADLPMIALKKIERMDEVIEEAKLCAVDCVNVDRKLRQILDLAEDEAHFHMKQSAFLYNVGVQTVPKSLHCFFMRLTMEYFRSPPADQGLLAEKIGNPDLGHYVVLSRNVLAASVTVNSTVMNSEETEKMVFHVVTDELNYFAMKFWFAGNSYGKAAIRVVNIDELRRSRSYGSAEASFSEEFRVTIRRTETEYMSVFGHAHFLLPELLKNLNKVLVLDDDVVVQRDLSPLWNLDMEGKVVAAVEHCGVRWGHLKPYLPGDDHDPDSCVWTSGLNVVDLEKWREHNVSAIYSSFMASAKPRDDESATLSASLLSFRDLVRPLDRSWCLPGLGHDHGISSDAVGAAAALHYDGSMKPWLELGIPRYKTTWGRFLKKGDGFMNDCNLSP